MRLNNKGFAITAVLYGLLILFVILVSSYLLVLSAKKDRIDSLISDVEKDYIKSGSYCSNESLVDCISNMYNKNKKEIVINNNIEYNYVKLVSLMNDRLGGTTLDYNGGNIRYYGKNPNNYIYFNCNDYDHQSSTTCEIWRIIGIFDNKVKITKDTAYGTRYWDQSNNNWHSSSLKSVLNETYYNNLNNSTTNLISDSTWYLGGYAKAEYYPNEVYALQQNGTKCSSCTYDLTWNGNIALMYPADYGYAVNFEKCNLDLSDYYKNECKEQNWLFKSSMWLLAPHSGHGSAVWFVNNDGKFGGTNGASYLSSTLLSVYPTLYLKPEIMINKGNGSSSNPYQIKIS